MTAPVLEQVTRHPHYPYRPGTCDVCAVHTAVVPLGLLVDAWLQRTDRLVRVQRSRRQKGGRR